ncbi:glycosyltransferase family 9 protein [Pelagibacteraceae bacterium]|jgi:heptosyltransferase-2|nr:glycosyltransferase family 9 protein [Pelagibacteraceae bacterium]|tara:strand:- start:507 stop:1466 length:960 start_codon:yes stop_codon:yes gene_type:complete
MKVLVIQPKIGMGDMIIYLPYIHAISKKYGVPVSLLVKNNSRASDLLSDDESINKIILLERNSRSKKGLHDGIRGFFKLINEIKTEKFDKVFIFNSSLRYFLVSKLAGIKSISQYPLFRKKDNVVISAKIFAEQELNQIIPTQPILSLASEKIEKKKKNFSSSFKHICIGLSASGPTKRWDVNNYINLCEKLNNKISCKFYLAGGNNDQKLISKFLNSKIGEHCLSFDNLKIKETMPIIKNCDIYIGNDTGWLHISSALGLKCLALFMDSPVMAYGKYSKNISIVVPEGETEETTTHDTLGKDRISFEKVYRRSLELLS